MKREFNASFRTEVLQSLVVVDASNSSLDALLGLISVMQTMKK